MSNNSKTTALPDQLVGQIVALVEIGRIEKLNEGLSAQEIAFNNAKYEMEKARAFVSPENHQHILGNTPQKHGRRRRAGLSDYRR